MKKRGLSNASVRRGERSEDQDIRGKEKRGLSNDSVRCGERSEDKGIRGMKKRGLSNASVRRGERSEDKGIRGMKKGVYLMLRCVVEKDLKTRIFVVKKKGL